MKYQKNYSKINTSLFDKSIREVKAEKISRIIRDFASSDLINSICLEVGCSTGVNTNFLSCRFGEWIGADIDIEALQYGNSQSHKKLDFIGGDAMHLPFRDGIFDIVVCNHVYEHVPDSKVLMDEIFRVLKNGGFCYFAAGNKYSLVEGHYKLPFLSWLPKSLAGKYLKLMGKGAEYYENHLSYFQLKRLVGKFLVCDYTLKIIKDPERFGAGDLIAKNSNIQRIPEILLKCMLPVIPTFIFILEKSGGGDSE